MEDKINKSGKVDQKYEVKTSWVQKWIVTPEYVQKKFGFVPIKVEAGKRDYDVYVTMLRAYCWEGMPLVDLYWKEAAQRVQYGGTHWLKNKFLKYSPMTYDYTSR